MFEIGLFSSGYLALIEIGTGSIEKGRYKWRGTPAWLAYHSLAKLEAEIKEQCTEIRERCTERTLKNCEHLEYTSQ